MTDFPPNGAYCIPDPHRPGTLSYWRLRGNGLEAWPTGARGKYGPARPARSVPGRTAEQLRDETRLWRASVDDYRIQVLKLIAEDPAAAAARFALETERCPGCLVTRRAEELPGSAAADGAPGRGKLTVEERQAIVADLRRAGHREELIARALGVAAKTVNRDARRAGIGAPLRPRTAVQSR